MSITAAELILFNSANMPTADTGTSGGAIDTAGRPELTQFTASAVVAVISDGADVRTITVTGRLASGIIDTEVITLTGAVEALGAKTFERILKLVASATSASRTVSIKQGSGGTTRATISVNETTRNVMFYDSASSPSGTSTRYEKTFFKNTNGSLALTGATINLSADPSSRIKIALAASKGDSGSVAARTTSPGLTFSDDGVSLGVPTGNLATVETIGVWAEQTLPTSDPAAKSTFTLQLAGSTI